LTYFPARANVGAMSEKKKLPREDALKVAREVQAMLEPFCERIEIAGSLRREKPLVGDIELLFVPLIKSGGTDLFGSYEIDFADVEINRLLATGVLAKRPSSIGGFTWGTKNKLGIHVPSGIPLDLFSTTQQNWWVSLVVRTGSRETNLELTTGAQKLGVKLNAYGCGITHSNGNVTQAHSERDVFRFCGVPYREPKHR